MRGLQTQPKGHGDRQRGRGTGIARVPGRCRLWGVWQRGETWNPGVHRVQTAVGEEDLSLPFKVLVAGLRVKLTRDT